jgi:UDP-N-acetylmuramate dehydrogenase
MFDPAAFESQTGIPVKLDVPGCLLTTIKIGGKVSYLIELSSLEDLCRAVRYFKLHLTPFKVLGAGSNLLISDKGVADPVIRLGGELAKLQVTDLTAIVGGGASLMRVSRDMVTYGLAGLEFAAGIPGTFGAAVKINAGAHGWDMSSVVESAVVVNEDGSSQRISCADFKYDYRSSALRPGQIVAEVTLKLRRDTSEQISLRRTNALEIRKNTQPLQLPSFGSVFKNPLGSPAALYIEKAGLKGVVQGGAQISEMHANWIVNPNRQASSEDVEYLIKLCQETVLKKFKIQLETEVVRW